MMMKAFLRVLPSFAVCPPPLLLSCRRVSQIVATQQEVSGAGVHYGDLATTLLAVEQEPARVAKEALMAELLQRALRDSPDELKLALSLASLQLSPNTRPLKLGMGNGLIISALAKACGEAETLHRCSPAEVEALRRANCEAHERICAHAQSLASARASPEL